MYELKSKQYNALKGSLSCAQIGVSYKHHLYSIGTYNNDHIIHIQNQTHYDANHTHIYQSHSYSSITLIFINYLWPKREKELILDSENSFDKTY